MKHNEMEGIYSISEQLGWRDPALAKMVVLDSQGCCKNYHKLGGLKPEKNLFPYSSGGKKFKIKVSVATLPLKLWIGAFLASP